MKFISKSLLLIMLVFAFVACEKEVDNQDTDDTAKIPEWMIETVDSIAGADVGIFSMLELDSDSGVHIAYVVNGDELQLKYAYKPYNGAWNLKTVANGLENEFIDICVDNLDRIFIAYELGSDGNLYIAEKELSVGSFSKQLLIDEHLYGYPKLYCNGDVVHISARMVNKGMRYGKYNFGDASVEFITVGNDDDIIGSRSGIVVDNNQSVQILWHDNDEIKHASMAVGEEAFVVRNIATGKYTAAYEDVGLHIDLSGNLHGYYMDGQNDNNIVCIRKNTDATEWTITNTGNSRADRVDRAIATDKNNNPFIVFSDNSTDELKTIRFKNSWEQKIVSEYEHEFGKNPDIAISDKNAVHISYYAQGGCLKYAWKRL